MPSPYSHSTLTALAWVIVEESVTLSAIGNEFQFERRRPSRWVSSPMPFGQLPPPGPELEDLRRLRARPGLGMNDRFFLARRRPCGLLAVSSLTAQAFVSLAELPPPDPSELFEAGLEHHHRRRTRSCLRRRADADAHVDPPFGADRHLVRRLRRVRPGIASVFPDTCIRWFRLQNSTPGQPEDLLGRRRRGQVDGISSISSSAAEHVDLAGRGHDGRGEACAFFEEFFLSTQPDLISPVFDRLTTAVCSSMFFEFAAIPSR